jgi:hypothetical protein
VAFDDPTLAGFLRQPDLDLFGDLDVHRAVVVCLGQNERFEMLRVYRLGANCAGDAAKRSHPHSKYPY